MKPPPLPEPLLWRRARPGPEPYACAGDRAYLVGAQNGDFPPVGRHLPGEMGGLWAHPIKLLDGFWFRVGDQWLAGPGRFTTYPWGCEMEYELAGAGLSLVCRQFVPDGEPALVVELEITAHTGAPDTITLGWAVCADLRPVWLGEQAGLTRGGTRLGFDPELHALVATAAASPWACLAGAGVAPLGWRPGRAVRLPGAAPRHDGEVGELVYRVALPADGPARLTLVVAGGPDGKAAVAAVWHRVRDGHRQLLAEKQARLTGLVQRAALAVPDPALCRLFDWAKVNFDWLVRRVPGMGSGIGGGLPDYPWWFGCDTAYTVYGLLAAGQPERALDSMRLLARLSDPATGRIIHEVTTAGTVYNPGNAQETPQYVCAAWETFCWTGDREFLAEVYPLCRRGLLDWALAAQDPDGDGLPGGGGIMEGTGLAVEALDTAVHTFEALGALRQMARLIGDRKTADRCRQWLPRVRAAIHRFWLPAEGLYGDVMATPADVADGLRRWANAAAAEADAPRAAHAGRLLQRVAQAEAYAGTGQLEQPWLLGNWVTACPLAAGLAPPARAARALERLESAEFSDAWGLRVNPYLEPNTMTISTAALVMAQMTYGRTQEALALLRRMGDALDHGMPGALGEFLPTGGCFVQAWSGFAAAWPLVGVLLGIRPQAHRRRVIWRPRLPADWSIELRDLPVGDARLSFRAAGGVYEVSGSRPGWEVRLHVPGGRGRRFAVAEG